MRLKAIAAIAGGLAVRTWVRAKAAGQITHPDVILGHADGKANEFKNPRRR
jgi:hypothetical protein